MFDFIGRNHAGFCADSKTGIFDIREDREKPEPAPYIRPVTRDRVIAAIYETVIRPELYDTFISTWGDHIEAALRDPDNHPEATGPAADLVLDPELTAHFARAYEILEQFGRKAPESDLSGQVRGAPGFALLADPDGRILAASDVAAAVLDGHDDISALATHLTAQSAKLLAGLGAAAKKEPGAGAAVVLATGIAPRHLIAREAFGTDGDGRPRTLLLIEALDYQWSARAEEMLVTSFGLSRAEVAIVRELMAGHSLREIAAKSGRSQHTVRNQAKAVLAKTGAPGQVDLIRLVALLINDFAPEPVAPPGASAIPHTVMTMASGHAMQVFRTGPANGRAVIFLHGMLDGMAPLQHLRDRFRRRGWQVVAPLRPGFGLSQAVGRPDHTLEVFVDHVGEMITRLGLVRPVVLGCLAGAFHGHILARRLHDRIAGMVAVSGGMPITRAAQLSRMAPRQRVVAYTARYAPALLPAVLRAGIAQIDSKDIGEFMTALYAPGTHDHGVIERLGLAGLIQSGYRLSVHQGHSGFAADSHFLVRDWSPHLDGPSAPVICLNGARDHVVSAAEVESFMAGREEVSFRLLAEAGQLLHYEHPDVVFAAMEELAGR